MVRRFRAVVYQPPSTAFASVLSRPPARSPLSESHPALGAFALSARQQREVPGQVTLCQSAESTEDRTSRCVRDQTGGLTPSRGTRLHLDGPRRSRRARTTPPPRIARGLLSVRHHPLAPQSSHAPRHPLARGTRLRQLPRESARTPARGGERLEARWHRRCAASVAGGDLASRKRQAPK